MKTIVERLVELRREMNLTQRDIGERMGIGQTRVSVFESGKHAPLPKSVQAYAEALGKSVGEVIVPAGTEEVLAKVERLAATETGVEQLSTALDELGHPSRGM